MRRPTAVGLALAAALLGAGCGRTGSAPARSHGGFLVVAAENFWGSIAAQLAGEKATVQSIIVNPGTDPHDYSPTAGDARAVADSSMAIVNGLGYDNWASGLLRASPASGRVVLNVGAALGLPEGSNPHRWYFPADVRAVIGALAADYDRLDPADAPYFARRRHALETAGLATYDRLREEIRSRFAGTPVGYSESVFQGLGEDLHLRLLTPYSFARAVAEGTDVSAGDKEAVDRQAEGRLIRVWVYNSQNATTDVQRVNELARAAHIPTATVTETLSPRSASFGQWQAAQLERLLRALEESTGRRG